MDEMKEEDRTAPISQQQVLDSLAGTKEARLALLDKLMDELNRKRDAYSGIVSSINYVIDSKCPELITELQSRIAKLLIAYPMRYGGKMFFAKVQARVVSERPLFVEEIYESILETTPQWSRHFPNDTDILALQIMAVKSIKNAEHQRGGRPSRISQEQFDKLCYRAILSCDSAIKIDTFSFIFESRSTTKLLTEKEFSLFKTLFQAALGLQEAALRQTFLAVTNRVLKRFKKSHEFVMRDKKLYSIEEKQAITKRYTTFLHWLIDYCFDNTYCNAYFGSFIVTVSTLKLIIQHVTYTDKDLNIRVWLKQRRCYDTLISCLADSFEENKSLALETLLMLPENEELFSNDIIQLYEKIAYELANSVNPAHSLTCQYMFKLVIALKFRSSSNTLSRNQIILMHLNTLVESVEDCLKLRQEGLDLVVSLKKSPNYPKLSCIRAILQEVDQNKLHDNHAEWCNLVTRVANCAIDSCQDISTVVCNPNPESIGHLPMDQNPIDVSNLSTEDECNSRDGNIVTSQMLLISGWKTIKESSLIFGSLCSKFWWPETPTKPDKCPSISLKPIMSQELVHKILHFFSYYMKRLRHRGAFEQASGGYTQVTSCLKSDKNMLNHIMTSLNETLNDFKAEDMDADKAELLKASTTRRSGGLPFLIQAKLNIQEEPEAIRSDLYCLFEVIKNPKCDSYRKIHCMNILGALIRQHSQGEKVMPYVGESFSIAFEAFKSDSYSIRNCANMLLKATCDRTFGVNRLRVDIHRKNQLSFEKFFSECPTLHQQMVDILNGTYQNPASFASIHAVFVVLFRLCPSLNPDPAFSPEKVILPFIQATRDIFLHCLDPQLRTIAAELTVRLENFYYKNSQIEGTSQILLGDHSEPDPNNQMHGVVMFFRFFIEYHASNLSEVFIEKISKIISSLPATNDKILGLAILELIENYAIYLPKAKSLSLPEQIEQILQESKVFDETASEKLMLGYILLALMYEKTTIREDSRKPINEEILDSFKCLHSAKVSTNLSGALIKLTRQIMTQSETFIDYILDKFDIDLEAALITPYDKLKLNTENDRKHDAIATFCHQPELREKIKVCIPKDIFQLNRYQEFRPEFSSSKCNNTFSIELLALAYKCWDTFDLDNHLQWNSSIHCACNNLNAASKMISDLPDCDVKCLVILCAGRHMLNMVSNLSSQENLILARESILQFSEIIDQLADGDSSVTVRESCVEVLRTVLLPTMKINDRSMQASLINLFSALIKLSQDEESNIRRSSDIIIASFRSTETITMDDEKTISMSRLASLISALTTQVFNPKESCDLNSCFTFLIRIIFKHSKNYSNNLKDQKERLFDKTKLNTFADFVSIMENTLDGLKEFFRMSCELQGSTRNIIELDELSLSSELIDEFKSVDSPKPSDKGDYSWRLTKITQDLSNFKCETEPEVINNHELMRRFAQNIEESLCYFEAGYQNILVDTEYIYHELSLFKRISFFFFILQLTHHKLEIKESLSIMQQSLSRITSNLCCTTLLNKCLRLVEAQ